MPSSQMSNSHKYPDDENSSHLSTDQDEDEGIFEDELANENLTLITETATIESQPP